MTAAELVNANTRLVLYFARPFIARWPALAAEIESAANLGLVVAAKGYDPARGKFSTFAGLKIRHEVMLAVDRERRTRRRFRQARPVAGPDGEEFDVLAARADHRERAPDAAAEQADDLRAVPVLLATMPADRRRRVERLAVQVSRG